MNGIPERIRLEIHSDRLNFNLAEIRRRLGELRLLAVVKADAYGAGVLTVARAAKQNGAVRIGVASLGEAMELLELGLPVQILSSILPEEIIPAVEHGFHLPVIDLENAGAVNAAGAARNRRVPVHIAIDSGMGRVGICLQDAPGIISEIVRLSNLDVRGIFSHFPAATPGDAGTGEQIAAFARLIRSLERDGITFQDIHMAASDGFCNFPAATQPPFTLARIGLDIYGFGPSTGLRPVLDLKSCLAAVRMLPAGSTIGYGRTWKLQEDTPVGTVAAGYADGIPLALSNRGRMIVHGRSCPIIGRVSMDYTMISLAGVPEAKVGDEVICWGDGNDCAVRPTEWAELKQTHVHDILCALGHRVVRQVIE